MGAAISTTPTFRALSHSFLFETEDPVLADYLAAIWGPLRGGDGDGHRYRLARPREEEWTVFFDGEVQSTYASPDAALA